MKYRIVGKYKNNKVIYKVQENPLFGLPLFWTTVTYWGPDAPHPDLVVPGDCTVNCIFSNIEDAEKCLNGLMKKTIDMDKIKEKAHQIAWKSSKNYDPILSKESWCEMAALEMAYWLEKQKD